MRHMMHKFLVSLSLLFFLQVPSIIAECNDTWSEAGDGHCSSCTNFIELSNCRKTCGLCNYITKNNYRCGGSRFTMKSRNLNDASQECDENRSCNMFFDYCGKGRDFDFCTNASSEITDNGCGSILHIKEHQDSGIACTEGHVCTHPKGDMSHGVTEDQLQRRCLKDAECKAIQYVPGRYFGKLCTSNSTKPKPPNESGNTFVPVTYSWKACAIKVIEDFSWPKKDQTFCEGHYGRYNNVLEAQNACTLDPNCTAINDFSCNNNDVSLCPVNYTEHEITRPFHNQTACLFIKPECDTSTDCSSERPLCWNGQCNVGVRCTEYGYALNCQSCHMTYGEQGSCGKDCVILNNDFSKKQDLATEQCIRRECPKQEHTDFHLFGTPKQLTVEVNGLNVTKLLDWNNDTHKYDNNALYKLEFVSDIHNFSKEITPMDIEMDKLSFEMRSPHKSMEYSFSIQYSFITSEKPLVCHIHKKLDLSVSSCNKTDPSSGVVLIDRLCDGIEHCNITKYDESDELCKGSNEFYSNALWISAIIVIALGFVVVFCIILKRRLSENPVETPSELQDSPDKKNETDHATISFILAVCKNPNAITPDKKLQKQIVEKLRQIYQPCRYNSKRIRDLIQYVYTFSLCKDVNKVCNLIIEEFLHMEEEKHGNRPKGFGCILSSFQHGSNKPNESNKGEDEYLSAYIKKVFERKELPSVIKRRIFEVPGSKIFKWLCCNESLRYYCKVAFDCVLTFAYVTLYYYDIFKDLMLTYSYHHISNNILVKTDPAIRFQSVGGIQFDILVFYSICIVFISELILMGYVWSCRNTFDKIFRINNVGSFLSVLISIFPIHCILSEVCMNNINILRLTRKLDRIIKCSTSSDNTVDEESANEVSVISQKIDLCNRQSYHINTLYRKVQLMESYTERQYQTILLTSLLLFSAPYQRIQILFNRLLFIGYWPYMMLNWCITMFSLVKSIIHLKDSRRHPVTPGMVGQVIQILVVTFLAVSRILFIALCVGNSPYIHPLGTILQLALIYMFNKYVFGMPLSVQSAILPSLLPCFLKPPEICGNDSKIVQHLKGHGGILLTVIYETMTAIIFSVIGYIVRISGVANDIVIPSDLEGIWKEVIWLFERYMQRFMLGEILGFWTVFIAIYAILLWCYYILGHPYKVILKNKGGRKNGTLRTTTSSEGDAEDVINTDMHQETQYDSTPPCSKGPKTKPVHTTGENPGIKEAKHFKNVPSKLELEVAHMARPFKHDDLNHKETEVKSKTNLSVQSSPLEKINASNANNPI